MKADLAQRFGPEHLRSIAPFAVRLMRQDLEDAAFKTLSA